MAEKKVETTKSTHPDQRRSLRKRYVEPSVCHRKDQTLQSFAEPSVEQIIGKANMKAAYNKVMENKGAPGVDNIGTRSLKPHLFSKWPTIVFKRLLPRNEAKLAALSGRGAWFNSGTKLVNAAFNLAFFKKYGLVSTLDIWKCNQDYRRTALVRNRMPGGVGGR